MSRKKYISIICITALVIIPIVSMIVSLDKFSIMNPFAAANGFIQITFTSKEYVEIQKSPRVIIARADGASNEKLIQYMKRRGYVESVDEQEGAMHKFRNKETDEIEYVSFSVNKYYSLWVWNNEA